MSRTVASFAIAVFVIAAPLGAQSRGSDRVPRGHLPPPGTCRVWIDGVPPGRQPAPTSCARAERARAEYGRNARVLYGDRAYGDRGVRHADRRHADERRYVDASGRVCTERTEYKKNGNRKTTIECTGRGRTGDVVFTRCDDDVPSKRCWDVLDDDKWGSRDQSSYPTTLPEMIAAVIFDRGQRTGEVAQWLGKGQYRVGYTDVNSDNRPELASWFDDSGRLVQQWVDRNRDGRADVVRVYESGQLVRVIGNQ
jgi:hypothetical protein